MPARRAAKRSSRDAGVQGVLTMAAAGSVAERLRQEASRDHERFWAERAQRLPWFRGWDRVFEWNYPTFRWFVGGETNLAYNCLDRHVAEGRGERAALVYVNERGERRDLTYGELLAEVERAAAEPRRDRKSVV